MTAIFGRAVIDTPTNKSGGALAKGDVVIVDTTNDHAVTTTTSAASTAQIGVVVEENGIANNAAGRVQVAGYVPLINVNASVTRGHYAGTHTVAKQAASLGASRAVGAFAQFLTGGATPSGILFGLTDAAGTGGGAPTTVGYIVGALDAGLSNEKVRADLFKNYHPDNYPTSGLTFSDEFDDASLDGAWGWVGVTPAGTVSESLYPGWLHIEGGSDASAGASYLLRAFVPGGSTAFTLASKVRTAMENGNFSLQAGIVLTDSSNAVIATCAVISDGTVTGSKNFRMVFGSGGGSVFASEVFDMPLGAAPPYLRMTRDASNVYQFWFSFTGEPGSWQYAGTATIATAVAKAGLYWLADTDAVGEQVAWDFIRAFTTVTAKIGA